MDSEKTNYRSYLLRLWWVEEGDKTVLRILVEDPTTGRRTGFSSLEDLVAFISKEVDLEEHSQKKSSLKNPREARKVKA